MLTNYLSIILVGVNTAQSLQCYTCVEEHDVIGQPPVLWDAEELNEVETCPKGNCGDEVGCVTVTEDR